MNNTNTKLQDTCNLHYYTITIIIIIIIIIIADMSDQKLPKQETEP